MDIQHSAFLTSAAPIAQHINQRLHSGKPITSSSDTFPMWIDHLPVWGLGLKDTIHVPQALQEVECLPDVLLNVGSAVLEMDQAALQLIVSLCTALVLTASPAFRAWPTVFPAECLPQGEI